MKPAYGKIVSTLVEEYTDPAASDRRTPWEVLLFTMLTARSRDEQVEGPFRRLMKAYPTPKALSEANLADVERILKTIGLYKTKSVHAIELAEHVTRRFGGKIPRHMDALVSLPGVGRKTASCTLVYAFGIPAIAVDTHVHRIVNRLGWVKTNYPPQTEKDLLATLPLEHWIDINRVMVQFGREVCQPIKPRCFACPVKKWCAFPDKTERKRQA